MASVLLPSLSLSLPKPTPHSHLSFLSSTSPNQLQLQLQLQLLSLGPRDAPVLLPPVRMGGGPRTFPGGVSKWQWKRMQAKKAKQLLKARLLRERQIYEMRKRGELKAAVADLEKPWEMVELVAPNLFSVSADDQVKALAGRFQRPGGFDMWSDRDGPEVFRKAGVGLLPPSARFFPKGVVHSVKPDGDDDNDNDDDGTRPVFDDWIARGGGGVSRGRRRRSSRSPSADAVDVEALEERREGVRPNANQRGNGNGVDVRTYGLPNRGHYSAENNGGGANQQMSGSKYGITRNHRGARRLRNVPADPHDTGVMDRSGEEEGDDLDGSEGTRRNTNAKAVGSSRRYGSTNKGWHRAKNHTMTLRPTSDLYNERGHGQLMGESKWNMEGNGARRNHQRSK